LAANGLKSANICQADPRTKSKIDFTPLSKKILRSLLRRWKISLQCLKKTKVKPSVSLWLKTEAASLKTLDKDLFNFVKSGSR